jgi:GNAT superfamily N-acetyltransferase
MPSDISLTVAGPRDAESIARLHAQSWRTAYRGTLGDDYLDRHVEADRLEFWTARFAEVAPDRRLVLKAIVDGKLLGFVCVLLDTEPQWGARLDNLHVSRESKGTGIGYRLFQAAREWIASVSPGTAMHLWCVERNHVARRFYDRQGGKIVQIATRPVAQELAVPELRYWWPALR